MIGTGVIEHRKPEEVSEEQGLLERELNGEIHIISFCGEFYKIRSNQWLSKSRQHQENENSIPSKKDTF